MRRGLHGLDARGGLFCLRRVIGVGGLRQYF